MARRRQQNPGSSDMIWIAALAVGAYFAYEYLLAPNASASTVVAAANPAQTGTSTSPPANTAIVTPPLGTPVTSVAQAALQSAANYPYIIPATGLFASLQTTGLSGYMPVVTTDSGAIFVRNDIGTALTALVNSRLTRAGGSALTSLMNATDVSLASIQQMMQTQNLSGLGLMGLYPAYNNGMMGWNN